MELAVAKAHGRLAIDRGFVRTIQPLEHLAAEAVFSKTIYEIASRRW